MFCREDGSNGFYSGCKKTSLPELAAVATDPDRECLIPTGRRLDRLYEDQTTIERRVGARNEVHLALDLGLDVLGLA